jgi:hypothetical protein
LQKKWSLKGVHGPTKTLPRAASDEAERIVSRVIGIPRDMRQRPSDFLRNAAKLRFQFSSMHLSVISMV